MSTFLLCECSNGRSAWAVIVADSDGRLVAANSRAALCRAPRHGDSDGLARHPHRRAAVRGLGHRLDGDADADLPAVSARRRARLQDAGEWPTVPIALCPAYNHWRCPQNDPENDVQSGVAASFRRGLEIVSGGTLIMVGIAMLHTAALRSMDFIVPSPSAGPLPFDADANQRLARGAHDWR